MGRALTVNRRPRLVAITLLLQTQRPEKGTRAGVWGGGHGLFQSRGSVRRAGREQSLTLAGAESTPSHCCRPRRRYLAPPRCDGCSTRPRLPGLSVGAAVQAHPHLKPPSLRGSVSAHSPTRLPLSTRPHQPQARTAGGGRPSGRRTCRAWVFQRAPMYQCTSHTKVTPAPLSTRAQRYAAPCHPSLPGIPVPPLPSSPWPLSALMYPPCKVCTEPRWTGRALLGDRKIVLHQVPADEMAAGAI